MLCSYWARHWACAVDVLELLSTEAACTVGGDQGITGLSPNDTFGRLKGVLLKLISVQYRPGGQYRPLLNIVPTICTLPCPIHSSTCLLLGPGDATPAAVAQRTTRQLWGLTARCERAIRAMAPSWRGQASRWGKEATELFERLLLPATWLCEMHQGMMGVPSPHASLRLLASSVATVAKAVQLTGIDPSFFLVVITGVPSLWRSTAAAACLPAVETLLLTRIGAASATLPEGHYGKFLTASTALDCAVHLAEAADPGGKQPFRRSMSVMRKLSSCHVSALVKQIVVQMTSTAGFTTAACNQRGVVHLAVGRLSDYGRLMVSWQWSSADASGDRGGASPQEEFLHLLSWTVPSLLASPLLDFLAKMQHVLVPSDQRWSSAEAAILPVHLMPASMDPDASESTMAMQVGGSIRAAHQGI